MSSGEKPIRSRIAPRALHGERRLCRQARLVHEAGAGVVLGNRRPHRTPLQGRTLASAALHVSNSFRSAQVSFFRRKYQPVLARATMVPAHRGERRRCGAGAAGRRRAPARRRARDRAAGEAVAAPARAASAGRGPRRAPARAEETAPPSTGAVSGRTSVRSPRRTVAGHLAHGERQAPHQAGPARGQLPRRRERPRTTTSGAGD